MQAYLQQLERLKEALQVESDTAFSQVLDVSQGAISGAKKRGQIPHSWFFQVHEKTQFSIDWLYCGKGPMLLKDVAIALEQAVATAETVGCLRCSKLEGRIEALENEWMDVSKENRQWAAKIEQILRENGDLRERCAKLGERLACDNSDGNRTQDAVTHVEEAE